MSARKPSIWNSARVRELEVTLAELTRAAHKVVNVAGYAELPLIEALGELTAALERTLLEPPTGAPA